MFRPLYAAAKEIMIVLGHRTQSFVLNDAIAVHFIIWKARQSTYSQRVFASVLFVWVFVSPQRETMFTFNLRLHTFCTCSCRGKQPQLTWVLFGLYACRWWSLLKFARQVWNFWLAPNEPHICNTCTSKLYMLFATLVNWRVCQRCRPPHCVLEFMKLRYWMRHKRFAISRGDSGDLWFY